MLKKIGGVLVSVAPVGALFVASSAHAAMDTTAALASFADVQTAIPVVGAAFLAVLGLLAAWKLVRGAFA